jgi:hypothetical protein
MNKKKTKCPDINSIIKTKCYDTIVPTINKVLYNSETKECFDAFDNYIGQGEFKNGTLKITPKTFHT